LQQDAANNNAVAIPAPTKAMISSFTSYQKLISRGGVAVGGQSIQDIVDFTENFALTPETEGDEVFVLKSFVDCNRPEPFFALLLSTKR
jgi:hypothetical protein